MSSAPTFPLNGFSLEAEQMRADEFFRNTPEPTPRNQITQEDLDRVADAVRKLKDAIAAL